MKFTKEEAFESLKGILTNNGKKTLRMSEMSINGQLDTLMPIIATEDMELSEFVEKTRKVFEITNSNIEKDNSDFVKQWKADNEGKPKPTEEPADTAPKDDTTAALLERIKALEEEASKSKKEKALSDVRTNLLAAMKNKGIKDDKWAQEFISEINITEDMDVEAKAETYLKIYNKSNAEVPPSATPFSASKATDDNKDLLSGIKQFRSQLKK